VRAVNAIPGVSRLDLFAEGQKLADGLEYKTITPFVEVPAGRQPLRLRPAGMDTAEPLAEQTEQLRAGQHYTAVIMPGEEGGPAAAIRIFDEPMDAPDENRAKLRVVHAAADAGADRRARCRTARIPLASGLEFQRASDFTELPIRPPRIDRTTARAADGKHVAAAGSAPLRPASCTPSWSSGARGPNRRSRSLVIEDRIARP
jgi:hypothetical protein